MHARKMKYEDIRMDSELRASSLIARLDDMFEDWQEEWFNWRDKGNLTTQQNLERQIERIKQEVSECLYY